MNSLKLIPYSYISTKNDCVISNAFEIIILQYRNKPGIDKQKRPTIVNNEYIYLQDRCQLYL